MHVDKLVMEKYTETLGRRVRGKYPLVGNVNKCQQGDVLIKISNNVMVNNKLSNNTKGIEQYYSRAVVYTYLLG